MLLRVKKGCECCFMSKYRWDGRRRAEKKTKPESAKEDVVPLGESVLLPLVDKLVLLEPNELVWLIESYCGSPPTVPPFPPCGAEPVTDAEDLNTTSVLLTCPATLMSFNACSGSLSI